MQLLTRGGVPAYHHEDIEAEEIGESQLHKIVRTNKGSTTEYPLVATTDLEGNQRQQLPTPLYPSDVDLYRLLRYEMPSAEKKLGERIQALIENDPETMKLQLELERAREAVREFEDKAAQAFDDTTRTQAGTIRLETGGVAIVWSQPAKYFTMARPLSDIYENEPTLAKLLGIEAKTKAASRPSFKIK